MRTRLIVFIPLILGLALRLFYLSYTPALTRQHDVFGHLKYITYLMKKGEIPANEACWECFQPPVYYVASTALAATFPSVDTPRLLQFFTLDLFMMFLLFGGILLALILKDPWQFLVAICLLTFWPSGVMSSSRIGNDVAFYFVYAVTLYFLYRWLTLRQLRDLIVCVSVAALAPLVKSTGFLLWILIAVFVAIEFLQRRFDRRYFVALAGAVVGSAAWILNFAVKSGGVIGTKSLIGIEYFPQKQRVGTGLANFLYFDVVTFLRFADAGPWVDFKGRQYFWNYAWKTSLFGEFDIPDVFHQDLAIAISGLLLVLLASAAVGFWRSRKLEAWPLLTANLALSWIALLAMRMWQPANCINDFRYIFPCLISITAFIGLSANGRLKWPVVVTSASFVALAAWYFVVPF